MSLLAADRALWERPSVVAEYANPAAGLFSEEIAAFERYRDDYTGKHVLDLGVGCGRTARWLGQRAKVYLGLDYSTTMVESAKELCPEYDIRWGDARDLSELGAESCDFVLFSYNGIDVVDDTDRKLILNQVSYVLRPGGVFAFSSHNLHHAQRGAYFKRIFRFGFFSGGCATHLDRAARYLARAGVRLYNYVKNARRRHWGDGYAILTEPSLDFAFACYHILEETQTTQLRNAGFNGPVETFDRTGTLVTGMGMATSKSKWLMYVVRK